MIAEILERLGNNAAQLGLKLVGAAAEFQVAAESKPAATPAVYVIPLDEAPQPNSMDNIVIQRVVSSVGIVLVVRNVSDAKGQAAGSDMTELRKAVKALLLGWQPLAGHDPLERGPGQLLAFRDGHMWWQDIYNTAYYDRSEL